MFEETISKCKSYSGNEIIELELIKTLHVNYDTLDDTCNFIDKGEFEKLISYPIINYNTENYLHVVVFKDYKSLCYLALIISPVELWEDDYVKRLVVIEESIYTLFIKNKSLG